ncbi:MAG: MBL fold metallo-hydrolase [Acidobacteriota bacterium]|nr:MBL fold metallo-hydrolase [Acidobacteriota bacterium]
MRFWHAAVWLATLVLLPSVASTQPATAVTARAAKFTVLSTMLSGMPGAGIGEWGFAGLLEVDGHRLLIDTGARPEAVLRNAEELRIDLSTITDLVLTHNHSDHTGGLLTLRRELSKKNPKALSRVHVPAGIFMSRLGADGREQNGLLPLKASFEQTGGVFIEHRAQFEISPGVWLLGPVARVHPERNFSTSGRLQTPTGPEEDNVPEDTAVVVNAASGLIVISGCGHAGIANTLDYARKVIREAPIEAAIGGFHLFAATDEQLAWTADRLRAAGIRHLLGAHCTGIEAVFRLRQLTGLARRDAVVGAVGSSYTLGSGIEALSLAK